MQNEPNFAQRTSSIKYPESRIEQKMSNEPNLQKTINEQRTMPALSSVEGNYEQLSNEPNFKTAKINLTSLSKKACANFYPLQRQKNEPNSNQILFTGLSINQFEQKIQNEPNFKNTKINVSSFIRKDYENKWPCGHRKNEPNLCQKWTAIFL